MYRCFLCGEDVTLKAHKAVCAANAGYISSSKLDIRIARRKARLISTQGSYGFDGFDAEGVTVVCPDCFVDAFPDRDREMAMTALCDSYLDYLPMSETLIHAAEGLTASFHMAKLEAHETLARYVHKRVKNPPM